MAKPTESVEMESVEMESVEAETPDESTPGTGSLIDRVLAFFVGPKKLEPGHEVLKLLFFVWLMIFVGLLSLIPPALSLALKTHYSEALDVIGVGLFIAGAAVACGSMLGFLFGVPKTNHPQGETASDAKNEPPYIANTNLEMISDWLSKVIVGVGLVEARGVVQWLDGLGQLAGAAMGGGDAMRVIATALLVNNLLMGFFQGFLVAYLYLPKVFSASQMLSRRG